MDRGLRFVDHVERERLDDLRAVEQPLDLLRREPVLDVLVLEDLLEAATPVVLADDEIVWIPGVRRVRAAPERSGRPMIRYICERFDGGPAYV